MSVNKKYISKTNLINTYQTQGIPGLKKIFNYDVVIMEAGLPTDIGNLLDEPIPYLTEEQKWIQIANIIKTS